MRFPKLFALLIGLLGLGLVASGCSSAEPAAPAAGSASETSSVATSGEAAAPTDYAAIIDVRTSAEYADGHVEGAINIDISDPRFDVKIAELSGEGTYLVYCRSGNRSAAAAERFKAAGLKVEDGGGLGDMKTAGHRFTEP